MSVEVFARTIINNDKIIRMPLDYKFDIDNDLLIVTTEGYDDNVDEAVSYGESILMHCLENNCTKVPMDESLVTGGARQSRSVSNGTAVKCTGS